MKTHVMKELFDEKETMTLKELENKIKLIDDTLEPTRKSLLSLISSLKYHNANKEPDEPFKKILF